ncbi:MAG: putative transposase [Gammaproteobacteria bacterium]|jgi:putative transposase
MRAVWPESVSRFSQFVWLENPLRYVKTSTEVIRSAVMIYIRVLQLFRHVEDLPHDRGIDISYETKRAWWNRFGPIFAT